MTLWLSGITRYLEGPPDRPSGRRDPESPTLRLFGAKFQPSTICRWVGKSLVVVACAALLIIGPRLLHWSTARAGLTTHFGCRMRSQSSTLSAERVVW